MMVWFSCALFSGPQKICHDVNEVSALGRYSVQGYGLELQGSLSRHHSGAFRQPIPGRHREKGQLTIVQYILRNFDPGTGLLNPSLLCFPFSSALNLYPRLCTFRVEISRIKGVRRRDRHNAAFYVGIGLVAGSMCSGTSRCDDHG